MSAYGLPRVDPGEAGRQKPAGPAPQAAVYPQRVRSVRVAVFHGAGGGQRCVVGVVLGDGGVGAGGVGGARGGQGPFPGRGGEEAGGGAEADPVAVRGRQGPPHADLPLESERVPRRDCRHVLPGRPAPGHDAPPRALRDLALVLAVVPPGVEGEVGGLSVVAYVSECPRLGGGPSGGRASEESSGIGSRAPVARVFLALGTLCRGGGGKCLSFVNMNLWTPIRACKYGKTGSASPVKRRCSKKQCQNTGLWLRLGFLFVLVSV
mmetsp:Transcript_752/g.1515  ORF Transcript_752/g.1515 Transcript_752/m.1515 type:complete len:264 (-) Transcript_752:184-975(-)